MAKSDQKAIARYFSKPPTLYIGGLGQVLSPNAGLLLSQLLYWHGLGSSKGGWIYKTSDDIKAELGLSRNNQDTAIKLLRSHGIIDYKLSRIPATRHFRVNIEKLHSILPSLKESNKLKYPNPPNYIVKNEQTITEITRKNTTKNTEIKVNKTNYRTMRKQLLKAKSLGVK